MASCDSPGSLELSVESVHEEQAENAPKPSRSARLTKTIVSPKTSMAPSPTLSTSPSKAKLSKPTVRALMIIDVQNDFIDGGLAVPGGIEIVDVINRMRGKQFDFVYMCLDWHPYNHISFRTNNPGTDLFSVVELASMNGSQVMWPDHCIQGSHGAEIHKDLATEDTDIYLVAGCNPQHDSYSVFQDSNRKTHEFVRNSLEQNGVTEIYAAGLATDYCVQFSVLDAKTITDAKVFLLADGCRGIDNKGVETAYKAFEFEKVQIIESDGPEVRALPDRRLSISKVLPWDVKHSVQCGINVVMTNLARDLMLCNEEWSNELREHNVECCGIVEDGDTFPMIVPQSTRTDLQLTPVTPGVGGPKTVMHVKKPGFEFNFEPLNQHELESSCENVKHIEAVECKVGLFNVLRYLQSLGSVNIWHPQTGRNVLHIAVSQARNANLVRLLLEHRNELGLDMNGQTKDGKTALMLAADKGLRDIVRVLTTFPDLDTMAQSSRSKMSALMYACRNGNDPALVRDILDYDIRQNRLFKQLALKQHFQKTALMYACMHSTTASASIVRYLICSEIDPQKRLKLLTRTDVELWSPLHFAFKSGLFARVDWEGILGAELIKQLPFNALTKSGFSMLHLAVFNKQQDVVRVIADGYPERNQSSPYKDLVKVNQLTRSSETELDLAIQADCVEIARSLLRLGCHAKERTPATVLLHRLVLMGDVAAAEGLLKFAEENDIRIEKGLIEITDLMEHPETCTFTFAKYSNPIVQYRYHCEYCNSSVCLVCRYKCHGPDKCRKVLTKTQVFHEPMKGWTLRGPELSHCECNRQNCSASALNDVRETEGYKYLPNPINTTDISLNPKLQELSVRLAENGHNVWAKSLFRQGWSYGQVRSNKNKKHPMLLPFDSLSAADRKYNFDMASETIKVMQILGYNIWYTIPKATTSPKHDEQTETEHERKETQNDWKCTHLRIETAQQPDSNSQVIRQISNMEEKLINWDPKPVNTTGVSLTAKHKELSVLIAQNSHEVWADEKFRQGWRYAPERNVKPGLRLNSSLVPFSILGKSEQGNLLEGAAQRIKVMLKLGFTIQPPKNGSGLDNNSAVPNVVRLHDELSVHEEREEVTNTQTAAAAAAVSATSTTNVQSMHSLKRRISPEAYMKQTKNFKHLKQMRKYLFNSYLFASASRGHLDPIHELLRGVNPKAQVNTKDRFKHTPLYVAAKRGHLDCVEKLLKYKVSIDARDANGLTPLSLAAYLGNLEMCQLLLTNRAEILATDKHGFTPIHHAARRGHLPVCHLLAHNLVHGHRESVDLGNVDRKQETNSQQSTLQESNKNDGKSKKTPFDDSNVDNIERSDSGTASHPNLPRRSPSWRVPFKMLRSSGSKRYAISPDLDKPETIAEGNHETTAASSNTNRTGSKLGMKWIPSWDRNVFMRFIPSKHSLGTRNHSDNYLDGADHEQSAPRAEELTSKEIAAKWQNGMKRVVERLRETRKGPVADISPLCLAVQPSNEVVVNTKIFGKVDNSNFDESESDAKRRHLHLSLIHVARTLIRYGANPMKQDRFGHSPYIRALFRHLEAKRNLAVKEDEYQAGKKAMMKESSTNSSLDKYGNQTTAKQYNVPEENKNTADEVSVPGSKNEVVGENGVNENGASIANREKSFMTSKSNLFQKMQTFRDAPFKYFGQSQAHNIAIGATTKGLARAKSLFATVRDEATDTGEYGTRPKPIQASGSRGSKSPLTQRQIDDWEEKSKAKIKSAKQECEWAAQMIDILNQSRQVQKWRRKRSIQQFVRKTVILLVFITVFASMVPSAPDYDLNSEYKWRSIVANEIEATAQVSDFESWYKWVEQVLLSDVIQVDSDKSTLYRHNAVVGGFRLTRVLAADSSCSPTNYLADSSPVVKPSNFSNCLATSTTTQYIDLPSNNRTAILGTLKQLKDIQWLDDSTCQASMFELNVYNHRHQLYGYIRIEMESPFHASGVLSVSTETLRASYGRFPPSTTFQTIILLLVVVLASNKYSDHILSGWKQIRLRVTKFSTTLQQNWSGRGNPEQAKLSENEAVLQGVGFFNSLTSSNTSELENRKESSKVDLITIAALLIIFTIDVYILHSVMPVVDNTYIAQMDEFLDLTTLRGWLNTERQMFAAFLIFSIGPVFKYVQILPWAGPVVVALVSTMSDSAVLIYLLVVAVSLLFLAIGFHVGFGTRLGTFGGITQSFVQLMRLPFVDEWDALDTPESGNLFIVCSTVFYILFATIIVNLFIAIVSDVYPRARHKSDSQWETLITDLIERNLTTRVKNWKHLQQSLQVKYWDHDTVTQGIDGHKYWQDSKQQQHTDLDNPFTEENAQISQACFRNDTERHETHPMKLYKESNTNTYNSSNNEEVISHVKQLEAQLIALRCCIDEIHNQIIK